MDSIVIKCKSNETLLLAELTEFQGELKKRDAADVEKIITSIKKYGFSFPFFVWKHAGINHVLDGHGRILALKELEKRGEIIPALPVVYVDCTDETEAKNKLLRLNSQYGAMTADSILDFMDGIEFDIAEVSLPDTFIEFAGIDSCIDMPELPAGEKSDICTMTFSLTQDQVETVKSAIKKATAGGAVEPGENKNSNGNALAYIAGAYIGY